MCDFHSCNKDEEFEVLEALLEVFADSECEKCGGVGWFRKPYQEVEICCCVRRKVKR